MNLAFLTLSERERTLYINQAAIQRNVSPIVFEKDFWVCWLLAVLFRSEFADHLVFKGGTSLSKVFRAIERFSEDIDLSLSPLFLKLSNVGASRNQANKWMAKAEEACGVAVSQQIKPALERLAVHLFAFRHFMFALDQRWPPPTVQHSHHCAAEQAAEVRHVGDMRALFAEELIQFVTQPQRQQRDRRSANIVEIKPKRIEEIDLPQPKYHGVKAHQSRNSA